jgi:hypothetical protein
MVELQEKHNEEIQRIQDKNASEKSHEKQLAEIERS